MTDDERNDLALELIEFTSLVLIEINDGSFSFPKEWKENIRQSFGLKGAGRPNSNETKSRDIEIATEFYDYKISMKPWINYGNPIKKRPSIDKYALRLAEKNNISDYKYVYKIVNAKLKCRVLY